MKLPDFPGAGQVPAPQTGELQGAYFHKGEEVGQAGHAFQYAGAALRELGMQVAVVSSQVEHIDAINRVADADAKAKLKVANKTIWTKDDLVKEFGSEGSIPQAIKDSVGGQLDDTVVGDPGNPDDQDVHKTGKTNIPGWAVNPMVYEKDMRAAVDAAAQGITLPGWRNEFLRQMHGTLTKEVTAHAMQAQQEMYQYLGAKAFVTADHLARNGQIDAGLNVLQMTQGIPPKEVEMWKERVLLQAGERAINGPLYSEDRAYIETSIAGLQSGNNEYDVTDRNGGREHVNVSALPIVQRQRYVTKLQAHLKELDRNDNAQARAQHDAAMENVKSRFDVALLSPSPADWQSARLQAGQLLANGQIDSKTWEHIDNRYKAQMDGLEKRDKKLPPDPRIGVLEYAGNMAALDLNRGGNGSFEYDGKKYSIDDPQLGLEMIRLGANPAEVAKLQKEWQKAVDGKPVTGAREETLVREAVKSMGMPVEESAQTTQAIKLDIASATRAKGKPLTDEEISNISYSYLHDQVKLTGTGGQALTTYAKEIPTEQRVDVARARQIASRLYGPGPQGTAQFHKDATPVVDALNKFFPDTTEGKKNGQWTQTEVWKMAGEILANQDQLAQHVNRSKHEPPGTKVTPEAMTFQYLSEHGKIINNKLFRSVYGKENLPQVTPEEASAAGPGEEGYIEQFGD